MTKRDLVQCVRFTGATDSQVAFAHGSDPRKHFKVGDIVAVEREEVHTWHTRYFFRGLPGKWFNSVCFEPVEQKGITDGSEDREVRVAKGGRRGR